MSGVDTRHIPRDSLFLLAEIRLEGRENLVRGKVRNLSDGGMMAEGDVSVQNGMRLSINLRNIGWIEGSVAWVQDNRFGIAFANEIHAAEARTRPTETDSSDTPRYLRPNSIGPDAKSLRKI